MFAELTWTHSTIVQAEDRTHRVGQEKSVNIYYLYGPNTLDELIFKILKSKSDVFAVALDDMMIDKQGR